MRSLKSREDRARRALAKLDCRLEKTPSRYWTREWHGAGYMVVDSYTNTVRLGCWQHPYDATIEQVEGFVQNLQDRFSRPAVAA